MLNEKMLRRVRSLIAKAEATTFEAEAAAFMTKAQELITTHSLQDALHAHGNQEPSTVQMVDLVVDNPYRGRKAELLGAVGQANRCRVVIGQSHCTLIGYPIDIQATDLIFSSLLFQASAAMLREGKQIDARGVNRTKSFRNAFIAGFASRIGQRLVDADQRVTHEAEVQGSQSLVPVLRERSREIDRVLHDAFPSLRTTRTRISNANGWHAGQTAGNSANLAGSLTPLP